MSGKVPKQYPSGEDLSLSTTQLTYASPAVHIVQLVYSSPTRYADDIFTNVAVFTSEERARLFVEWAGSELERIRVAALKLRGECIKEEKEMPEDDELNKALNVPNAIAEEVATCHYTRETHHFQYAEEFDLDPMFG